MMLCSISNVEPFISGQIKTIQQKNFDWNGTNVHKVFVFEILI